MAVEAVIDYFGGLSLSPARREKAKRRFYRIVEHFETAGAVGATYSQPRLIRYSYEFSRSDESKDRFLRAFFKVVELPFEEEDHEDEDEDDEDEDLDFDKLRLKFLGFADYLFDNFFLPLKAAGVRTPQPSPAYHSAVQSAQGKAHHFVGTPDRVSSLRGACLVRDRYRCVIFRKFDLNEAERRIERDGDDARDNDGSFVQDGSLAPLEVAHIIPHSLTSVGASSQLDPSQEAAFAILNMFDIGVLHLIDGPDIDRPRNAVTLTRDLHHFFGSFKIYFTAVPGDHTYRIEAFRPRMFRDPPLPVTRSLYLANTRTIDPPSPRLLALHRAIAHILHLSAAGDYIDKILRDMDEIGVRSDGSTELDRLVALRLGGWIGATCS